MASSQLLEIRLVDDGWRLLDCCGSGLSNIFALFGVGQCVVGVSCASRKRGATLR